MGLYICMEMVASLGGVLYIIIVPSQRYSSLLPPSTFGRWGRFALGMDCNDVFACFLPKSLGTPSNAR